MKIRGTRTAAATLLVCVLGVAGFGVTTPGYAGIHPADAASPVAEQSDQPAPQSQAKLVLDHGHLDAFTTVLDDTHGVRLELKEDVTGLNVMHDPETVLLHVKPSALLSFPEGVIAGLAGDAYHLPLIQNPDLLWPGWETQLIVSEFPDANTALVVSDVVGPGEVFLWSQNTFGAVTSLLADGGYRLPGTISQPYPAHTHAAWAFTQPGTYTLTVRADVTAANGRTASSPAADYVFVVGELAAHQTATVTSLVVDRSELLPADPVTLTATVAPSAPGAVQFRDESLGTILGHSPVSAAGSAEFRTAALPPGEHRISAEFVPTWSTDFAPSAAPAVTVTVIGEQTPKPSQPDTVPATEPELQTLAPGTAVRVTSPQRSVPAGGVLTAQVAAPEQHGEWVSVWVHHTIASWLGWIQLDLRGSLSVALPHTLDSGEQRLVLKDRAGTVLGWDRFQVRGAAAPVDPGPPPAPVVPPPPPTAPTQECMPQVTLDHGHIDAFTVSAGGGLAVLQILEDVTGHRVLREPETVLLKVKESAFAQIPGLPGGPAGYVLPLSQNQDLIWPGWDTNRTSGSGFTDVSIRITEVNGPGTVSLYTSQGAFGGWRPLLTHGGYAFPGTIHEPTPAHTHAQWVFGAKGIYVLTAHAVATNPSSGQSLSTRAHTYVFQVGDVPLGDVFCGLVAHGAADAQQVNAAVLESGQQAVAAQQAAVAEQQQRQQRRPNLRKAAAEAEQARRAAANGGLPLGVILGVVGGGVLLLAGVAGGTVWLVRGLRADGSELNSGA